MRLTAMIACAAAFVISPARGTPVVDSGASCAGWSTPGTIVMQGRTTGGGLDGTVARTIEPGTGRWSEWTDYGGFKVAAGFDGAMSWSRDRSGGSHQLNSDFARKLAVSESWIWRRGWCKAGAAAREAPIEKTEDGKVYSISRVTPEGGAPIELWMDATGLPYRVVEQLSESHLSRTFSAWRKLPDGAMVPSVERVETPEDESAETLSFTSIERSDGSRTAFAQPARPRDYAIIGGASSTTVPYEADLDRVFVPVMIDGKGPLLFELDTGGHLILTADAASGLALSPVGAFSSTGGGQGVVKAGFVRVHELRIGDAVMREQPAKVLPLAAPGNDRGPRPPRAGILGLELFERFAVRLDRRAHTMTLTPLEAFGHTGGGTALPLYFTEDAPLTHGAFEGVAGDIELDTGNAGPAIVEGLWATQHGFAEALSRGTVTSGSGVGGSYRQTVGHAKLALGPFALPGELVSYVGVVARGSESVQALAANFGEPILAQFDIIFDYGRNVAWLAPLPARQPRPFNRMGIALAKERAERFTITSVIAGSPAELAGLAAGDFVIAIDGRKASALAAFDAKLVFLKPAGTLVTLSVQKPDGEARDVSITLADFVR